MQALVGFVVLLALVTLGGVGLVLMATGEIVPGAALVALMLAGLWIASEAN